MIKAILIPVLVGTCALYARAEGAFSSAASAVPSQQDFQLYEAGDQNVHRALESDRSFWSAPSDPMLVSTTVSEDGSGKYLDINSSERPAEGLLRLFVPHNAWTNAVTNAYTAVVDGYTGLYSTFKTKFPLYDAGLRPECDGSDRLVLWARKDPLDESKPGQLFVSAGFYSGSFRNPVRCDYLVTSTNIDPEAWHEVTIRTIPDITAGYRALGFAIWIDQQPVIGATEVTEGFDPTSSFTAEARALIGAGRLFPSLTAPGFNASVALGGVAFTGIGSVDDFSFATNAPAAWAKAPRTFTLCWDAGVTAVTYRVAGGAGVVVPASAIGVRSTAFEIPADEVAVTVDAWYDTANDYAPGIWTVSGACALVTNIVGSVTNYSFSCHASSSAAVGFVRSFRREIGLSGGVGSYATFADAKRQALAQGAVIVLNEDFSPALGTDDEGTVMIDLGESVTIDLNGHSITNSVGDNPTIVNYGELTIVDSQGGGRVASYSTFTGGTNDAQQIAVQNYASSKRIPQLYLRGGIYDGYIKNSGVVTNKVSVKRLEGSMTISRNADCPDDPQFRSIDSESFPYERYLDDPSLYYVYEEPFWKPLTNAFIWCGKGDDDKWSNTNNWRCGRVPAAGDYAIFPPAGTNVWEADMGTGIEVRDIWFAGDTILHGSADFTDVKWTTPSDGRILGDAVLTWNGKLPPDLSTLLDPLWAGTVVVSEVGDRSPKLMSNLVSWGTAFSKVTFRGVRGYYHLTANIVLPYTLELVNGAAGYGWKNDAGFTGGVITFPSLTGSGSFVSPKNTIANRQIIIFRDVMSFTGTMDVQGKRVVLGPGDAATLEAGSVTWSNGVKIKGGFKPSCRVAAFGGKMDFSGEYNDEIAVYTGSTVNDSSEVVNMVRLGETAELCVTNPVGVVKVVVWSDDAVIVDGRRVLTGLAPLSLNSRSAISAPVTNTAAFAKLSFARYYSPSVVTNGQTVSLKLALNELAVPVIGGSGEESAEITFADGMVSIVISGVIKDFYYGLEYKAALDDEWPTKPYIWTQADTEGGKAELNAPADGASGFYRVVVSDVDPTEEDGE